MEQGRQPPSGLRQRLCSGRCDQALNVTALPATQAAKKQRESYKVVVPVGDVREAKAAAVVASPTPVRSAILVLGLMAQIAL